MFGFPPILDGNAGIKFTRDADSGFPKPGIREIFYSVRDGDWLNPNVWQTASGRVGLLPTANDDVYVRHTINANTSTPVNNVFVSGTSGKLNIITSLTINGNFKCSGTLDLSGAGSNSLILLGIDNFCSNYINGTSAVINYQRNGVQPIMNMTHGNLTVSNPGLKYLTADTVITGNLNITFRTSFNTDFANFDNVGFRLTVNGTTSIGQNSIFYSTFGGDMRFDGLFSNATNAGIRWDGNPNVEFRGGLTYIMPTFSGAPYFNTGTGTWTFSTNNQNITITDTINTTWSVFNCNILVSGAITVTNLSSVSMKLGSNSTLNGDNASSVFLNRGVLLFANNILPMATLGTFNNTSFSNTVGYYTAASFSIPLVNFWNLAFYGGIKTLSANTNTIGNLLISFQTSFSIDTSFLELSIFDLTVNGITTINQNCALSKNGSGNVLFVGLLTGIVNPNLLFTGNPNVECRGGITMPVFVLVGWNSGTGIWSFTTNNQSIVASTNTLTFTNTVIISGAITLTNNSTSSITISGSINGNNASSRLVQGVNSTLNFGTATAATTAMTTGIWDFTTNANTIGYTGNYSATIPSYFTTFHNLTILGSGVKTLGANTTLNGNLILGDVFASGGSLQLSTFNFTVSGTTTINLGGPSGNYTSGRLLKSGSGNVLFVGIITGPNQAGQVIPAGPWLDFSGGNPNVELRNSIQAVSNNSTNLSSGTGTWTFSTNSQNINTNGGFTFNCPIIIGTNVTLGIDNYNLGTGQVNFNNTINGASGTSILRNIRSTSVIAFISQVAAQGSMSTGVLDVTTLAGFTVQYAGNYSATIPSYLPLFHNLTISGTGTKTTATNITTNGAVSIISSGSLTLGGNLSVGGNLTIGNNSAIGTLECSTFNLSVTGTTTVGVFGSTLSKNGAGNILFVGQLNGSDTGVGGSRLNLSGNPNVELRGGANVLFTGALGLWNTGTGTWTFTTNPQTLTFYYVGYNFTCTTIISGVTVTVAAPVGSGSLTLNGTIDGTNASSILNLNGRMNLANSTQVLPMFTNGTFNPINAATSILGFTFNGNYTLPYTTLNGLAIGGTGTKTLGGNTTVTSFAAVGSNSTFELSTFNFTNNGATNITAGTLLLSKNGAGTITFVGLVSITSAASFGGLSFTGNPNVEFRNGFTNGGAAISTFSTGTGTWTFSTISQTLTMSLLGGTPGAVWNCSIVISGAITLTLSTQGTNFTSNGVINGTVAGSTLLMGASANLFYNNTTQPMATGVLDTSTNLNTFIYGSGNQQVKGNPIAGQFQQYRNLTLNGGGNKTLQGNINVQNTYTVTAPAALVLNGFTKTP